MIRKFTETRHMQLTRDVTGISKTILILLLLISFIAGALFSYVYTMGYYAPSEFRIPENSVMTIQSVEFSEQDAHYFDVTVLNPSYSPSEVSITRIEARTTEDNLVHVATNTVPSLPFTLQKGESQTFRASWNWASYAGIKLPYSGSIVEIRVFLQDGRGEIFETRRPVTSLLITDYTFHPSISVDHFNLTVENQESSQTYVNITAFTIDDNPIPTGTVTPSLPYTLNPGDAQVQFRISYNWIGLMGQNITVGAQTIQGYMAQRTVPLPMPVTLDIPSSQIIFNATISPQNFTMTVTNYANSSTYVDISRITVAVGQQTPVNITLTTPNLPIRLDTNTSSLIVCRGWDWSTFTGQTVRITVYTTQGFIVSKQTQIP
jgi:hypothetical protein